MNIKNVYARLMLAFFLFGTLYVSSKYLLSFFPVFTLSFLRFFMAFIFLSMVVKGKKLAIDREDRKYILLIGIAGYFVSVCLQMYGIRYAGASTASLLNAMNPISISIFAVVILKERLTKTTMTGLLIAIFGIYLILGSQSGGSVFGVIFSLCSVLIWSYATVMVRRIAQKYDPVQVTRYAAGIAACCYLPIGVLEQFRGHTWELWTSQTLGTWLVLLYFGFVCTGYAYALWNISLTELEASICASFYPIQPMIAALFGSILLHEAIGIKFAYGTVLITIGILLSQKKDRRIGKSYEY